MLRSKTQKFCPTLDCDGLLTKPAKQSLSNCPLCKKQYCFQCLRPSHPTETCDQNIEKEYMDWSEKQSNILISHCKNCFVRIEKDGGCPNMICQMCKHEWCWICKADAPVHTETCPHYPQFLELLEFQGLGVDFNNGEDFSNTKKWFLRGRRASCLHWFLTVLALIIVVLPLMLVITIIATPILMFTIIGNCCKCNSKKIKLPLLIMIYIATFGIMYAFIPFVLLAIVIPFIIIYVAKKGSELG